jgi:hypothetical protein
VIQAKLFLCSDSAVIDARTNTISAFHIMEQINSTAFPVIVPRLSIVAMFEREETDPATVQLQVQIYSGNQQLFAGPLPVNFFQQLQSRTIVDLNGLVVPGLGSLRIVLRNEEQILSSWIIAVNQVGQPRAQLVFPPQSPTGQP